LDDILEPHRHNFDRIDHRNSEVIRNSQVVFIAVYHHKITVRNLNHMHNSSHSRESRGLNLLIVCVNVQCLDDVRISHYINRPLYWEENGHFLKIVTFVISE
jgi:hypothetical protein